MCISFFKVFNILFLRKVTKNLVLPEEKFVFLILHRNAITLQHLIIQFPLCYPSSDHLRVVKSKRSEAVTKLNWIIRCCSVITFLCSIRNTNFSSGSTRFFVTFLRNKILNTLKKEMHIQCILSFSKYYIIK